MRRSRLIAYLIALVTLVCSALIIAPPGAQADTATLEIANEAWFARYKQEDPQADSCGTLPGGTTTPVIQSTTTQPCGPVSPGDFPAPQSKATGHYVVACSGGEAGEDEGECDTGWAAFQWDTFDYFGATAEKFVVTLHQGVDRFGRNQGDTWTAGNALPPMQACNILAAWSGEPGSNPWDTKPKVSDQCVPITQVSGTAFTIDVTPFADSWLAGTGHGFVIRPGTPTKRTEITPFQITFAGYYDPGTASAGCDSYGAPSTGTTAVTPPPTSPVTPPSTTCTRTDPAPKPTVTFAYTPAPEDDLGDFDDFGGGDEDFFEDIGGDDDGGLEAVEDLDVIPTDVGSEDFGEDVSVDAGAEGEVSGELAAPTARQRTRPISTSTPFPWIVLLLLPLAAIAFWGTGTALGPVGDPVTARRGGVSRVLAERQAAHRGSAFETRNHR